MVMISMAPAPSDLTQRLKTDLWGKAVSGITIMSAWCAT